MDTLWRILTGAVFGTLPGAFLVFLTIPLCLILLRRPTPENPSDLVVSSNNPEPAAESGRADRWGALPDRRRGGRGSVPRHGDGRCAGAGFSG